MGDSVFLLTHVHDFQDCGHEDLKIIGVYKSRLDAETALAAIKNKNGFRDQTDGFSINERKLGETSWREGYVTAYPDGTFSE